MRPTLWTTRIDEHGPATAVTAANPAIATAGAPGSVSITARPRPGEWLADELRALHEAGVRVLVSALTDAENRELGLSDEASTAEAAGLSFYSLPIADRGLPDDTPAFLAALEPVAERLMAGKHVAVHTAMWGAVNLTHSRKGRRVALCPRPRSSSASCAGPLYG